MNIKAVPEESDILPLSLTRVHLIFRARRQIKSHIIFGTFHPGIHSPFVCEQSGLWVETNCVDYRWRGSHPLIKTGIRKQTGALRSNELGSFFF